MGKTEDDDNDSHDDDEDDGNHAGVDADADDDEVDGNDADADADAADNDNRHLIVHLKKEANKAKAISAKLFELNLKVQLYNSVILCLI